MNNKRNLDLDIKLLRWISPPTKKLQVRRVKDGDYEYAHFLLGNNKRWKTHELDAEPVPAFTEILDLCYHYIVPKLDAVYLSTVGSSTEAKIRKGLPLKEDSWWLAESDSPSMALCLAIEKLIDYQQIKSEENTYGKK